jgi:hypothetical protein
MLDQFRYVFLGLIACSAFGALAPTASATVTLAFGNRLVQAVQDGVIVQDFTQDTGTSGLFVESATIEVPDSGVNSYGKLFAEQDSTINALNWFGTGGVAIDGHVPPRSIADFGGQATSVFQVIFQLTCATLFTLDGELSEVVDGGDAEATFDLREFAGISSLLEFESTGGGALSVSEATLLAPGEYVFTAKAFAIGDEGTNFFDRANFQFDVSLEEQCVVPEPASMAVWTLIGVSFVGMHRWQRRGRANG